MGYKITFVGQNITITSTNSQQLQKSAVGQKKGGLVSSHTWMDKGTQGHYLPLLDSFLLIDLKRELIDFSYVPTGNSTRLH